MLDWAAKEDITWINAEAMLHFLMQKPEVQEFIKNANLNFYTLQGEIDNAHYSMQSGRKEATEQYPERLGKYDNRNPDIESYDFNKISGIMAQMQLKGKKPDVVDAFAAAIIATNNKLGTVKELIQSCKFDEICRHRLEEKGWVDPYKDLRKVKPQHFGAANKQPAADLLSALQNPDVLKLLQDAIAVGVQQGLRAHEEEKGKDISGAMAKGWTGRI